MLGEDDARSALAAERGRLLATRSALRRERPNDSRETDAKDVSEVGAEMAERTEETLLLDELDADLEAVDAAVVRLDTGQYGRCVRFVRRTDLRRPTAGATRSAHLRRS